MSHRMKVRREVNKGIPGFYQGWDLRFHNRKQIDRRYWRCRRIFSVLIVDPLSKFEIERAKKDAD